MHREKEPAYRRLVVSRLLASVCSGWEISLGLLGPGTRSRKRKTEWEQTGEKLGISLCTSECSVQAAQSGTGITRLSSSLGEGIKGKEAGGGEAS